MGMYDSAQRATSVADQKGAQGKPGAPDGEPQEAVDRNWPEHHAHQAAHHKVRAEHHEKMAALHNKQAAHHHKEAAYHQEKT